MPHNHAQYYVMTARAQQGIIQQTWKTAASAVLLAAKLREAGHIVEVMDPMGNVLNPERSMGNLFRRVGERNDDL